MHSGRRRGTGPGPAAVWCRMPGAGGSSASPITKQIPGRRPGLRSARTETVPGSRPRNPAFVRHVTPAANTPACARRRMSLMYRCGRWAAARRPMNEPTREAFLRTSKTRAGALTAVALSVMLIAGARGDDAEPEFGDLGGVVIPPQGAVRIAALQAISGARQPDRHNRPAFRVVQRLHLPAMSRNYLGCDGKTEPSAFSAALPRPSESPEHHREQVGWENQGRHR